MPLNYDKLMSTTFEPVRQTYARRDTMLYALGVGVGALDPFGPPELKYVYEKNLVARPTRGAGVWALWPRPIRKSSSTSTRKMWSRCRRSRSRSLPAQCGSPILRTA